MEHIYRSRRKTFRQKWQRSFLFRAQAVFFARLIIASFYGLVFVLSLAEKDLGFPTTWLDAALILLAFFYARICYNLKGHNRWSRWAHFWTLIADLALNLILTRSSGLLLSPIMMLHPLFTAMFLLLFSNPIVLFVPLLCLPIQTFITLGLEPKHGAFSLIYALLLYTLFDALIIFFIHLVQSQEQRLMRIVVNIEKKMKKLALAHERARIAKDFHDGIGAGLTSIVMQCDYLVHETKKERHYNDLLEIRESAVISMEDMRRSIALLYEDFDIAEQIARLCESMKERHRLNVEMRGIHFLNNLIIDQQIACCRIVQESLTNALKHAQASAILVYAERDEKTISLIIKDDGIGFTCQKSERHHFGLGNMYDRARNIGATLTIRSEPYHGTEITLSISHEGAF